MGTPGLRQYLDTRTGREGLGAERNSTTLVPDKAKSRAVSLPRSGISSLTSSCFSISSTPPLRLPSTAYESDVWPDIVSAVLGLGSSLPKRNIATPSCPPSTTCGSGVLLYSISVVSALASLRYNEIFTPSPWSPTAHARAVLPVVPVV